MRHRRLSAGHRNRAWLVYSDEEVPFGTNFGDILLKPRMNVYLAFEQDVDRDGLFARHEFNLGSSDLLKDTDGDGLFDAAEVRDGWMVEVAGHEPYEVFPHPGSNDSDGDGVLDNVEQDCGTDPRKRDTDDDGIIDADELGCGQCCVPTVVAATGAIAYLDPDAVYDTVISGTGTSFTTELIVGDFISPTSGIAAGQVRRVTAVTSDTQLEIESAFRRDPDGAAYEIRTCSSPSRFCNDDTDCAVVGVCCVDATGANCDNTELCDSDSDCDQESGFDTCVPNLFPTCVDTCEEICPPPDLPPYPPTRLDPRDPDTDEDSLWDGIEDALGSDNLDPADAGDFLDTDEDGLPDSVENVSGGWDVTLAKCSNTCAWAYNTICQEGGACDAGTDCADCGAHVEDAATQFSDPTRGDTDFDGLPDLLEKLIGTNPNDIDTDGDGLLDFDEFANFGEYLQYNYLYNGFFLTDSGSRKLGTDPTSQDSDGDGLSDNFEYIGGWSVLSVVDSQAREVNPSPLLTDSDFDGLDDLSEFLGKDGHPPGHSSDTGDSTDPTDPDTDGDGRLDGSELNSNPLIPDIAVNVNIPNLLIGYAGSWYFEIAAEILGESQKTLVSPSILGGLGYGEYDQTCGQIDVTEATDFTGVPGQTFRLETDDVLVLRIYWGKIIAGCGSASPCRNTANCLGCRSEDTLDLTYSDLSGTPFYYQFHYVSSFPGDEVFSGCNSGGPTFEITVE